MTKFGKIFCNLVANFKGVQLSPLGFAACQSKNCTNNANRANYRRVWHPAIPTQQPNYLPTEATETTEVSDARYSPTDCTDVHRLGAKTQPKNLWASVKSVGEYPLPEASVNSVNSVGGYALFARLVQLGTAASPWRVAWVWQDAIPS